MMRLPPRSTLFPYPTLFRSRRLPDVHADAHRHPTSAVRGRGQAQSRNVTIVPAPAAELSPVVHAIHVQHVHPRSEEHTSELQSRQYLVCRLLLEKKKERTYT